jgi:acetyltransferase-like isoleucine patch superfamily enzyme
MEYKLYENVRLGRNVVIEPYCIIGQPPKGYHDGELETIIGDGSIIRSHTVIYAGNRIGSDFQTGHHVTLRENNMIGNNCAIGTYGEMSFNIKIANNVKFHSDCHIYEDTIIEEDVRFNPGVFVLNTKYPYRPGQKPTIDPVIIRHSAIIAAKCTLMPGVQIGRYALIGAGSLVTKNVPDFAVAYGHPAVHRGDIRMLKDSTGQLLYEVKE